MKKPQKDIGILKCFEYVYYAINLIFKKLVAHQKLYEGQVFSGPKVKQFNFSLGIRIGFINSLKDKV